MKTSIRGLAGLALASLALTVTATAETADEVIAKYLNARGGVEKIKAIQSVEMTTTIHMMGRDLEGKTYLKRPMAVRTEMMVEDKVGIRAYDGTTAWSIFPFHGASNEPQVMPVGEATSLIQQADIDGPLVDYKSKGNTVELIGKQDLDGSPAWKIKLTKKNGNISYIYFDALTGLKVKETSKVTQQGSEIEVDTYLTNYKPVNGVLFPFSTESKAMGQPAGAITIRAIKLNVPLDDAMFHMPAATSKQSAVEKQH